MALFLKSNSVSIANGATVVAVTGGVDCGQVVSGTAVFINGILVEGLSGTAPDGTGASTITLSQPWTESSVVAGKLVAFNTFEGMADIIRKAREATTATAEVMTSFETILTATTPTVVININGTDFTFTPYGYLQQQSEDLIAELTAATGLVDQLEIDVAALSADVAAQQGIVDANLAASNSAATTATTQAGIATTQAGIATTEAGNASAAASSASGFASDASASAIEAATQVGLATTQANNSATSAAESEDWSLVSRSWAITPENTVVPSTSQYSALHWAAKAEYWAGQAAGAAAGSWVYAGLYNANGNTFPPSATSGQVYEISAAGTLTGFENIAGSIAVAVGDRIAKTATGWIYEFGGAQLRGNGLLPTSRGGTGRNDGKAPALVTARNFSISGKAVAANVAFDGTGNVNLVVTGLTVAQSEVTGLAAELRKLTAFALL